MGAPSVEWTAARLYELLQGEGEAEGAFFELTQVPTNFVFKFLRTGADSADMAVDGGTPVVFRYTVPAGKVFELWRINWHIIDGSLRADGFGGLAVLGNGLLLRILKSDESAELDFTDGMPLKRHSEFAHLAGVDLFPDTSGVGGADDALSIRWTIARAGRAMLLTAGQHIECVVQDDLSDLTHFQAMVQGILRDA
jgi:hypothetical protein